jgi:hypothetical protein
MVSRGYLEWMTKYIDLAVYPSIINSCCNNSTLYKILVSLFVRADREGACQCSTKLATSLVKIIGIENWKEKIALRSFFNLNAIKNLELSILAVDALVILCHLIDERMNLNLVTSLFQSLLSVWANETFISTATLSYHKSNL